MGEGNRSVLSSPMARAAEHVAFSWTQTIESAFLVGLVPIAEDLSTTDIACVESCLVHYRCLVNFCCGNWDGRWMEADIKASDFIERDWRPPARLDRRLRGRLRTINANLAHLSWRRLDDDRLRWPLGMLAHEAQLVMTMVVEAMPLGPAWSHLESARVSGARRVPAPDLGSWEGLELAPPA